MTFVSVKDNSFNLMEHWFNHYRKVGITGFHLVIDDNDQDPEKLKSLQPLLNKPDIKIIETMTGYLDGTSRANKLNDYKALELRSSEYVMTTDSDEFIRNPIEIAAQLRASKMDYVMGVYLDRFTLDGTTAPIRADEDIFKTFPKCATFSFEALGANYYRTPMSRPNVRYSSCSHYIINQEQYKCPDWRVIVHHFKWTDGIIQNIRARLERGFGSPEYQKECRYFLENYVASENQIKFTDVESWVDAI